MLNCSCCQQPVDGARHHPKCLKKLFQRDRAPVIPFGLADIPAQVIGAGARMSISGVQPKLSVRVNPSTNAIETVSEGGTHILKPEPNQFPELPQNENLCMTIAESWGLPVPPHGLFPLSDGKSCYLVRRFDRLPNGEKLPKETMFQILGAENKYTGSLEQVGKALRAHAANVGLDCIDFFERALLCFLIGNGDMHLKNWSLLTTEEGPLTLAPCYDLVSSKIYLPDESETALTLNGRQHNLSRSDFEALGAFLKIDPKALARLFAKAPQLKGPLKSLCRSSELSPPLQEKLLKTIDARFAQLGMTP